MFFTVALAHVEFCWVNTFMSLIVQTTYSTINHLLQTKKPHAYMFPLSCVTTSHTICRTKTKLKTLAKMYNLIGIVQVRVAWYIFCWSTLLFILRLFADFFFVVSILAFCSFLRYFLYLWFFPSSSFHYRHDAPQAYLLSSTLQILLLSFVLPSSLYPFNGVAYLGGGPGGGERLE